MSVIEILTRVDAICKKYDKYDIDKQKDTNITGDDAFARLYAAVESDIEAALQVSSLTLVSYGFLYCSLSYLRSLNCPVIVIYRKRKQLPTRRIGHQQ